MKVLVVGSGCREHALVRVLQEDSKVTQVYVLPERISLKDVKNIPASFLGDVDALANHLLEEKIDLVIIGPEQPLVDSWADILREKGLKVFGPSGSAAQLEGSKIFAKQFMKQYKIPTASYQVVSSVAEVLRESENFFPPYVLKADGLAGGKGVFLCSNIQELEEKAQDLFEKKIFGVAGERALLEDFQSGEEISIFVLTNGEDYEILPVAKDYKRLYEDQKGPNTGGMGAIAPVFISKSLKTLVETSIIQPTLRGLKDRGASYQGILYLGLMVHKGIPKILEYNIRFGDPEAQVLLPLLEGSWLDVFYKISSGQKTRLQWKNQYATCVVLASQGYPDRPVKGAVIEGLIYYQTPSTYFLHGGIHKKDEDKKWQVQGGRVLNVISIADSKEESIKKAYEHVKTISWKGLQYRKDIGN
ncbi:MAG: phosphoribosylamine--glycine ligase [Bdellovibrionales bacterium]